MYISVNSVVKHAIQQLELPRCDQKRVALCVGRYSKPKSFSEGFSYVVFLVWNAVKALFGQSDWQQASKSIRKNIFSRGHVKTELRGVIFSRLFSKKLSVKLDGTLTRKDEERITNALLKDLIMKNEHVQAGANKENIHFTPKDWGVLSDSEKIQWINKHQPNLADLGFRSSEEAVRFIIESSVHDGIEYLDFNGLPLNNKQFKHLSENCPNLKHLMLKESLLTGDILRNLKNMPNLVTLDLSKCDWLGRNALENLKYVRKLSSLNIELCDQLDPRALENLTYVPDLKTLNIGRCRQLEPRALKNLKYVQKLTSLNIWKCRNLDRYALDNLRFVPHLDLLDISECFQLDPKALNNLRYVQKLTSLTMEGCKQFEAKALYNLKYVKMLSLLDITCCATLEDKALECLRYVPNLTSLIMMWCKQLEPKALENLCYTPKLTSLDIAACDQLERCALKSLRYVRNLFFLDLWGCNQLAKNALWNLKYVKKLSKLNTAGCNQLDMTPIGYMPNLMKYYQSIGIKVL